MIEILQENLIMMIYRFPEWLEWSSSEDSVAFHYHKEHYRYTIKSNTWTKNGYPIEEET